MSMFSRFFSKTTSFRGAFGIVGVSLFASLFSHILFPGTFLYFGDQFYYFPAVLRHLDPSLFPYDFLLQGGQTEGTLFDDLLAYFMRIPPYSLAFWGCLLSLLSQAIFFSGVILLGKSFAPRSFLPLLLPFLLIIGGEAFSDNVKGPDSWFFYFEPDLQARSFGMAISTLALGFFFREQYVLSGIMLGFCALLHPINPLPVLLAFSLFLSWKSVQNRSFTSLFPLLFPVGMWGALFFFFRHSAVNRIDLFRHFDDTWFSLVQNRSSYILPSFYFSELHSYIVLFVLVLFALLLFRFRASFPKAAFQKLVFFVTTILVFIGLFSLLGEGFRLAFALQFQPLRAFSWIKLLFVLPLLLLFAEQWRSSLHEKWRTHLFLFALVGMILGVQTLLLSFFVALFALLTFLSYQSFPKKFSRKILLFGGFYGVWILSLFAKPQRPALLQFLFFRDAPFTFEVVLWIFIENILTFLLVFLILSLWKRGVFERIIIRPVFSVVIGGTLLGMLFLWPLIFDAHLASRYGDSFEWIQQNTPKDALFFVTKDAEIAGLRTRMLSQRSVFVSYLEGAQSVFSRKYALEFHRRQLLQQSFQEEDLQKEGVDYIICSQKELFPSFGEVVHEDSEYVVLKLSSRNKQIPFQH